MSIHHPAQVVRLCAKSRETVASPVEHLTLHYIVKHLDTPDRSELRKLQQVQATAAFVAVQQAIWLP